MGGFPAGGAEVVCNHHRDHQSVLENSGAEMAVCASMVSWGGRVSGHQWAASVTAILNNNHPQFLSLQSTPPGQLGQRITFGEVE